MNPILRESVETLSMIVDVTTGLAHPLDDTRAKELFVALHEHGISLLAVDVRELALDNSWSEPCAQQLAELAEKIGKGFPVDIQDPDDWGEPTVKRIVYDIEGP